MPLWSIIALAVVVIGVLLVVLPQLPPQNRFIELCNDNEPAKLRDALQSRAGDPNKPGWFGLTPLGQAITGKRAENVKILLEYGANPKGIGQKQTPLHDAVDSGDKAIAELLLKAGADPNQPGTLDKSAFVYVCLTGKVELVGLLLQYGAKVTAPALDGENVLTSVLALAVTEKKPANFDDLIATIEILLENGGNPNSRSKDGTPMVAIAMQNLPVLHLLLEHGAITDVAWNGQELGPVIALLLEHEQQGA